MFELKSDNCFQEMCIRNDKLQEIWQPKQGDRFVYKPPRDTKVNFLANDINGYKYQQRFKDMAKWLPYQHQLQKLIFDILKDFNLDYLKKSNEVLCINDYDMNISWLCYVSFELWDMVYHFEEKQWKTL